MKVLLLLMTAIMAVGLIFSAAPADATPTSGWTSVSVVDMDGNLVNHEMPTWVALANGTFSASGTFVTAAGTSFYGLQGDCVMYGAGEHIWVAEWSIYDGTSKVGNWTHNYGVFDGNAAANNYGVNIGGSLPHAWTLASGAHVTTVAGHTYYLSMNMLGYDNGTGVLSHTYQISIVVREAFAAPAAINWVNGIMWTLIVFTPAWLLNFVMPRFGLILGLGLMMGVVAITQPTGLWVAFMSFLTLGATVFTMRSD